MWRHFLSTAVLIFAILNLVFYEPLLSKEPTRIRTDQHGDPLPKGAVARLGTAKQSSITTVAWSPNGEIIATGEFLRPILIWDAATGKELRRIDGIANTLAWSPKGNLLGSGWDDEDRFVHLWDVKSGKQVRQLVGHDLYGVESLAWSPDGTKLASSGSDRTVRLWDVTTGKEVQRLRGHSDYVTSLAWSPNGKTLASCSRDEGTVRLWQVTTGKEVRRILVPNGKIYSVIWSPDGKMLALDSDSDEVYLWEVATGKEACRLSGVSCLAWSPDGAMWALGCADKTICLCKSSSSKEILRFIGHAGPIDSVVWSPNGKKVASGNGDGTVLIWAVGKAPVEPPIRLNLPQLKSYWIDLASDDSIKAYKAIRLLAQGDSNVVTFLGERLKPVPAPNLNHASHLIKELDNNQFSIRQKATRELELLGELAESALRRSLENNPSLEKRKRITELLNKLSCLSGERLRVLRAITVLEGIGTAAAKRVLEALARGTIRSRLTQEAKESLIRLDKKRGGKKTGKKKRGEKECHRGIGRSGICGR